MTVKKRTGHKNPKQKGNSFENRIAKQLSLWVTNDYREDVLIRTATSGARATQLLKSGKIFETQAGDIIAVEEQGLQLTETFLLECKHYKDANIESIFFGGKTGLNKWWERLVEDCKIYKRSPMLIVKQNFRPILLGISPDAPNIKPRPFADTETPPLFIVPAKNLEVHSFETFLKENKFVQNPSKDNKITSTLKHKKIQFKNWK